MQSLSPNTNKRITSISDKSGIAKVHLIEQMLKHVLEKVEKGGRMTIDLSSGNIIFDQPSSIETATPSRPYSPYDPCVQSGDVDFKFGVSVLADPAAPKSPRKKSRMVKEIPDDTENWRSVTLKGA